MDGHEKRITGVRLRGDEYVNAIQFQLNGEWQTRRGGDGGEKRSMIFEDDEYINQVTVRDGHWIDSITITTNKGQSIKVGGNGGSTRMEGGQNMMLIDLIASTLKVDEEETLKNVRFKWAILDQ